MSLLHPHHLVRGTLVLAPYAPDGDSIRFTPDSLDSFSGIYDDSPPLVSGGFVEPSVRRGVRGGSTRAPGTCRAPIRVL